MNQRASSLPTLAALIALAAPRPAPAQDEAKPEAKEKQVTLVQLTIKGALPESVPPENPFGPSPLNFKGLLDTIRKAKSDAAVDGIILKVESPSIGLPKAREIAAALRDFRSSGKKIHAFAEQVGTIDLILLSAADRVVMPESGMAMLPGVSAQTLYMKSFLARLGIRFIVAPVGEYKSAYENFARDEMSPELREVLEIIVGSRYQSIQEIIGSGRSIPGAQVAEAMDRAFLAPAELKELGLVDEIASHAHFLEDVKADLDATKARLLTSYGRRSAELDPNNPFAMFRILMEALSPPQRKSSSKPKIAVIYATGVIMPGKSMLDPFTGQTTVGSETMVDAIKKAADDETVKAIVLRIDSPGGSGTASDAIWHGVAAARAKKPVVASMSDVAGSGGYYIAMGANRIVAQPDTITGSIGVVSALVNIHGTMDLLGIRVETISRGKNAALFSPFADPEKVSLEPLKRFSEKFYWQFVEKAAAGRGKSRDDLHAVARGRVWTGSEALERGLVDEIGGLDRAMEVARDLARVPAGEALEVLELPPAPNFFEAISEAFGGARAASPAALLPAGAGALPLGAIPEARDALRKVLAVAAAAREGPLLLLPFEVTVR
jgi:protease-4